MRFIQKVCPRSDKVDLQLVQEAILSSLREAVSVAIGEATLNFKEAVCRALVNMVIHKINEIILPFHKVQILLS